MRAPLTKIGAGRTTTIFRYREHKGNQIVQNDIPKESLARDPL